ncbi:Glycosyltransferase involved in cell wall bisynthesis [bacterium A37T11]|nr:Glycosyltransferase involved in cell wall bisynthesis [bacterium A37T11]
MLKYSVCIPAFKARFLEACIQSILEQHVVNFELIILNDCSPEPVADIVNRFSDPRIRYFENEKNTGAVRLTDNWNKCLELANGEFIVIMGDDDRLEPDFLAEFDRLTEKQPGLDVYHCRSLVIDDLGQPLMLTPSCPEFEYVCDHIWHRLQQWRSQYISDFVYRTDSLRERGGFYYFPLAWGSDDVTAYMAMAEKGIAHTQKPVFNYRSNGFSITSTGNDLEKMNANLAYGDWLRKFLVQYQPKEGEKVMHAYLLKHLNAYIQQRKNYTMALSMRNKPFQKARMWANHRKEFDISLRQILLAAFKGRNLKHR